MGVTWVEHPLFTFFQAHNKNPTEIMYMTTQIVRLRKPSGICKTTTSVILNHKNVATRENINLTKNVSTQKFKNLIFY